MNREARPSPYSGRDGMELTIKDIKWIARGLAAETIRACNGFQTLTVVFLTDMVILP